jgi:hypothetical protein
VLDQNRKEYKEAQQEVEEHQKAHFTCIGHYLGCLCHGICLAWAAASSSAMANLHEPIDHTKLLHKWGYQIKHFV